MIFLCSLFVSQRILSQENGRFVKARGLSRRGLFAQNSFKKKQENARESRNNH